MRSKELTSDKEEETPEAELECLKRDCNATTYAFFEPTPNIEYIDGCRVHVFKSLAKSCKGKGHHPRLVNWYLDTKDAGSTSNLREHAKLCWSEETLKAADATRDLEGAHKVLKTTGDNNLKDSQITATFERLAKGHGKVTYSHRQHTKTETKAEIVRWVAESMRPFKIVKDRGFQSLMKTGRLGYYIPSPETVLHDVKQVFVKSRQRIATMLQKHKGALHFATDTWTSPNHKAYIAVTVHYKVEGVPISMLLDLVEVARSHSGLNLASAFAKILDDFGIADKVLGITCDNASNNDTMIAHLSEMLNDFAGEASRS